MNILIPDYKIFDKEDLETTFTEMGHNVLFYTEEPRNYRHDPRFRAGLRQTIREQQIDCLFSWNYYPVISTACMECTIPYISWCYDNPLVLTYSDTIFNPCNHVFLFDSQMVLDLQKIGASQVYYMPLAVNTKRLDQLTVTPQQRSIIEADVSFVGSLYNEKHNLFERMTNLPERTRGYLDGVMQAQRMIYGYNFLENVLTEPILKDMVAAAPLKPAADGHETLGYLYANYFLDRKITQQDRLEAMEKLDACTDIQTKLYTPNPTPQYTHIQNMGTVQYQNEMPLVFRHSKINLNLTLRSIQNGIPLRAMDIMGAGGFLLTNYQNDFTMHFTDGEDYVSYESLDDMMDKIHYYLQHDDERREIAANGHKKVSENHNFKDTLTQILEIALS